MESTLAMDHQLLASQMFRRFPAMLVVLLTVVGFTNTKAQYSLASKGDLIVGGMFPIQTQSCSSCDSSLHQCRLYPKGLFLAEAMVYAVRLVNERGILPFNISLGYNIRDTCNTLSVSMKNALEFASDRKISHKRNQTSKQKASTLISVVGAGTSELSLAINNVLSLYSIPQVAYASSATFLNDKSRYKTFLRVLPPDILQAKAIAQLVAHFKWDFISLVSSDDHYAGPLRQAFREEARRLGICLSNDIVFSLTSSSKKVVNRHLIRIKNTKNSSVILLFASEENAKTIITMAKTQNLTGRVWIASDSWSNAIKLIKQQVTVLRGGLGILFSYRPVKGFIKHLQYQLNKSKVTSGKVPWLRDLTNALKTEGIDIILKSKSEHDEKIFSSVFARVDYVINSVFIISRAIREFCLDFKFHSNATEIEKKATCLETILPKHLLKYLFNRTIEAFSKNITIDEKGDPSGSYDFYNLQESGGKLNYVGIGGFDSRTMLLQVNDSMVDLGIGAGRVPRSRCSRVCSPGYYVIRKSMHQCCWQCKLCPSNEVSNVTMATSCEACSDDHVANNNRSQCVYVPLSYLTWTHPWTIVLCILTFLGFFMSCFTTIVFVKHRHSPVVRASCFEISVVLLLSIALGFLIPIFQLSKPSSEMCKVSALLFAVVFTLILSLTLAKINRTVLILNNRQGNNSFHTQFLLSKRVHFTIVTLLTAVQISICITWFNIHPPKDVITKKAFPNPSRYLHCTNYTSYWFLISSGFLILLSLLCTILAFRSRNFPENYNHAKFISLAMFTFDMVWLTFMGAYYGNTEPGFHHPVIHSCAILFSNLLLLLFIFAPKVYVIFFRPELNNARTFREMNLQHILGTSQATRNFSLASIQGHGNVYLMDCDENNKAVQTPRTYTREAQTQTDHSDDEPVQKTSLVHRLFRIGSGHRKGRSGLFKRGYSESDTPKKFDPIEISGQCHSSPYPLYSYSHLDKDNEANGLHIIEEGIAVETSVTIETAPEEKNLNTKNDTSNVDDDDDDAFSDDIASGPSCI